MKVKSFQKTSSRDSNSQYINYLYAVAVIFCLVTVIIFLLSGGNLVEQQTLLDLYFFPVLIAAVALGWRWGLFYGISATLLTILLYTVIPRVMGTSRQIISEELIIRTVLLNLIALAGGWLSDSERRQKEKYRQLNIELQKTNTKLQQKVLELTLLYDTARQLGATLNLDHIMSGVLKSVSSSLGANAGFIYLKNNQGILELQSSIGEIQISPERIMRDDGKNILDYVSESGVGFLIGDMQDSKGFNLDFKVRDTMNVRSLACTPLALEEKIIGIILITNDLNAKPFDTNILDLLATLSGQAALAIDNAITYQRINQAYVDIIGNMVSSIETRDLASIHHCQRTLSLGTELAKQMNVPWEDITAIGYILLIDHLGQISPDKVIRTMGADYLAQIHEQLQFTKISEEILTQSVRLLERVAPIIQWRYEWYDGTGQPEGKQGEEIPLPARIVSIVETYHNLVFGSQESTRKYTLEEAITHLQSRSGKQFDPAVVSTFIQLLRSSLS